MQYEKKEKVEVHILNVAGLYMSYMEDRFESPGDTFLLKSAYNAIEYKEQAVSEVFVRREI